jgi:hypothetical protein
VLIQGGGGGGDVALRKALNIFMQVYGPEHGLHIVNDVHTTRNLSMEYIENTYVRCSNKSYSEYSMYCGIK